MKLIFFVFSFFVFELHIAACAIRPTNPSLALNYKAISQFEIGKITSEEVIKKLGQPSSRIEKDLYYSLVYNDQATGVQRVTLNFLKDQKTLSGFLWVPQKNEEEISFDYIRASYKSADFKEVRKNMDSHSESNVILFKDEKLGASILYDKKTNLVQGIARYDINNRIPADTKRLKSKNN